MKDEPRRIPIAERLAKLNAENPPEGAGKTPAFNTGADDAMTSTSSLSELMNTVNQPGVSALTVTQAGQLGAAPAASVDLNSLTFAHAEEFDAAQASDHHLLLLSDQVDPRELEALALSLWEDAAWEGVGRLRLTAGAYASGPWRIRKETRQELGSPVAYPQAWVIEAPQLRGQAAPDFLTRSDPVAAAFPKGMPAGLELEVMNGLQKMARRLAGAVRVAGSGRLIHPDPDGSVTMTVFAPRWAEEEDLTKLLQPYFPDLVNSRDVDRLPRIDAPERVQTREELALAINVSEDELARIAEITREVDAKAMDGEFVVRGYSLVASAGNTSRIHVTVQPAEYLPLALRYQDWPAGQAIEFMVQWIPPALYLERTGKPSRAVRLERMRVKDQVEWVATLIARATGGEVVDEDEFLVALS